MTLELITIATGDCYGIIYISTDVPQLILSSYGLILYLYTCLHFPLLGMAPCMVCGHKLWWILFFVITFFFLLYFTLQYCIGLPYINMNPPRVYTCSQTWTPLPPPSPYHLSGSSQCISPKHPASCIKPRLAIHFLYDIIHVSMPFSHIIPPSPSPTESKRLFYTPVSLLLSRIQGYRDHLSKFHIYALVYWIGVFLSGLLHSV